MKKLLAFLFGILLAILVINVAAAEVTLSEAEIDSKFCSNKIKEISGPDSNFTYFVQETGPEMFRFRTFGTKPERKAFIKCMGIMGWRLNEIE